MAQDKAATICTEFTLALARHIREASDICPELAHVGPAVSFALSVGTHSALLIKTCSGATPEESCDRIAEALEKLTTMLRAYDPSLVKGLVMIAEARKKH